jgi:predicted DNA-binding protein with PD1-like motif
MLFGARITRRIHAWQSAVLLPAFDPDKREYRRIPVHEQVEVLSLIGDIALRDGAPQVHAHVVIRKGDGSAHGAS